MGDETFSDARGRRDSTGPSAWRGAETAGRPYRKVALPILRPAIFCTSLPVARELRALLMERQSDDEATPDAKKFTCYQMVGANV